MTYKEALNSCNLICSQCDAVEVKCTKKECVSDDFCIQCEALKIKCNKNECVTELKRQAVEKQISKKPIRDLRKGIECYCPICNSYVGYYGNDNTQNNYCSDCGQAIRWGKEDE